MDSLRVVVAFSSSLGAICLAGMVDYFGMDFIHSVFPGLDETQVWKLTDEFMQNYGLWVVFGVAVTPFTQPPSVILAALSNMALTEIFLAIFIGRSIKYLLIAWISSHAPKLLGKMWGLRKEIEEVDDLKELV